MWFFAVKMIPGPAIDQLRALLGERFSVSQAVREHHGRDESYFAPVPPEAVAFARSTDEVARIIAVCRAHRVPVIPFGAGTSVEGHILAVHGGLCLDLSQMNRIVEVHAADMDATVEAGVTRKQLNDHLRDSGLFFAVDPGAEATLGGMAATRASGTNAVRYGTMRDNVIALTVVLADGRVAHTARRARKSAAGYDLTRLFVGSEGTLGVITEVTVRLHAVQEALSAAVCSFPGVKDAVDSVIEIIQSGVPIARCEFLDALSMRAINRHFKTAHPERMTLFLEFHGSEAGVAEQAAAVQAIAREHGGSDFAWATRPEERSRLWHARHNLYFAGMQLKPGARYVSTDVCVPISRLSECLVETQRDLEKSSLPIVVAGHVGDGNFHLGILFDPQKPGELDEAKAIYERLVARALAMDGTCTGEHGVGLGKVKHLVAEHGEDTVSVMRDIKHALDPDNLMNPGKVLQV
ncbi:MAG: 2-hydroxy-acid oxidase [Betaproteobacteria bacterium RIFCSPLOWO2_12_FULL_65_14]|nr:MAG: 2-hydroxy-acid oxidase [Betaproteobacteria bacterium RIFCSPLOWO2_12_FULL_65_14]